MSRKDLCLVLATDREYFPQLQHCLATIRRWPLRWSYDIKVIATTLSIEQLEWLEANRVAVVTDVTCFPRFPDGPDHAVAMTCRPYIAEAFPGYRAYVWIDADIRFLRPEGLAFYAEHALNPEYSIVITHEAEESYTFNSEPLFCAQHHRSNCERIGEEFDPTVAEFFQSYCMHNSGLFSARADSPIWVRYQRNLEKSMRCGSHWAREQDALNVSLIEVGDVRQAPSTFNWLCSFSLPIRDTANPTSGDGEQGWVSPREPSRKIAVAHLSNSTSTFTFENRVCTRYEYYRMIGLSA